MRGAVYPCKDWSFRNVDAGFPPRAAAVHVTALQSISLAIPSCNQWPSRSEHGCQDETRAKRWRNAELAQDAKPSRRVYSNAIAQVGLMCAVVVL